MRDPLSLFREHLSAHRSPATVAIYVAHAATFLKLVARPEVATCADVEAFLARPRGDGERRAPSTRNQMLAALRALSKFGLRDLGWTGDPTVGIEFAKETRRDPAVLAAGEVRELFLTADRATDERMRPRTLAILALLSQVGLRVHELVGLDVSQVDVASATLIGVRGKGGTVADLPLNPPALALVLAWLRERSARASDGEPALFVSRRGTRLSIRAVQHLLMHLRVAMGTKKRLSAHALRHSFATINLMLGADLSTIGELLRHSSFETTRKYLHMIGTRGRDAVGRLAVTIPPELLADAARAAPIAETASDVAQVRDPHALSGGASNPGKKTLVAEGHFYDEADDARPRAA